MKKNKIIYNILGVVLAISFLGVSCQNEDTPESMYDLEIKNAKSEIDRFEKEFLMKCFRPEKDDYSLSDWRMWGMGISFGFTTKTTIANYNVATVDFNGTILGDNLAELSAMEASMAKSDELDPVSDEIVEQWISMYREFLNNSVYPEDYLYRTIPLAAKFVGPYCVQTYSRAYGNTMEGKDKLVKSYNWAFYGETFIISGLNYEDLSNVDVKKKYLIDLHTAVANIYAYRNGMADKMKEITGKTADDKNIYTWWDLASDEIAIEMGFINKTAIVGAERDFSETFRYIITHTKEEIAAMKGSHPKLEQKIDLVLNTYQENMDVDLLSLKL